MLTPNFTPFPVLTTTRLLLRQMTRSDAAAVHRLRSNPEVMKYIGRPLTQSVEDAEKWIGVIAEALEKADGITWAMCLAESPGEHIGNIGLWRWEKENHRAEIGYMIEPGHQGNGLMGEALEVVMRYGFGELGLHSIEGRIDPRNGASASVLKRAGFVQEAYFKENYNLHGQFVDTMVFSALTPIRGQIIATDTAIETGAAS